jgi:hypothetical protein
LGLDHDAAVHRRNLVRWREFSDRGVDAAAVVASEAPRASCPNPAPALDISRAMKSGAVSGFLRRLRGERFLSTVAT